MCGGDKEKRREDTHDAAGEMDWDSVTGLGIFMLTRTHNSTREVDSGVLSGDARACIFSLDQHLSNLRPDIRAVLALKLPVEG